MNRDEIAALVAEYNYLADRAEKGDQWAEIDLEYFLNQFPLIANYDARGNYIGPVRHENGGAA